MFQIERQEKMLHFINKNKKAKVKELSLEFGVSKVTIRRDLDELAEKGLVIKTHGGVLSSKNKYLYEIPYASKSEVNSEVKRKIGIRAAKLIEDNDIIILDAGSTTLEVAKNIKNKNVTVISNDIKIGMEIADKNKANFKINLIIAGGVLSDAVYTLMGNQTVDFFKKAHVNKTFLGCDAIDLDFGLTNRTMDEVDIKKAMMKAAEEVIMVTDSSKLNKKVFFFLCETSEIDKLIIDRIDEDDKKKLEENGVEVIIV